MTHNTTTAAALSRVEAFCRAALELSRDETLRPEALESLRKARMVFLGGIDRPNPSQLETYFAVDRLLDRAAKISSRDLTAALGSLCKTQFVPRIETLRLALVEIVSTEDDVFHGLVAALVASPSEQAAGAVSDALFCLCGSIETPETRAIFAAFERLVGALLPDASF